MQRRITTSSRIQERGFTVVELISIIVVLSILAAIAVGTVSGYQISARDRERKADTATISEDLERYYRTNAVATGPTYPASTVTAAAFTTIIDDSDATTAPDDTGTSILIATSASAQTPTVSDYIYQPLNVNGTLCTTAPCVKYKLYYKLESSGVVVTIDSLRQQ